VQQALDSAGEAERPGLEEALKIVERAASAPEGELRACWVRRRLASAGYNGPHDNSVKAVRALRKAEPHLSLYATVQLTKAAAEREQAR
jgi:hypothetical protein